MRRSIVTVDELDIPTSLIERLKAIDINLIDELALYSPFKLAEALKVSLKEAELLIKKGLDVLGLEVLKLDEVKFEEGLKVTTCIKALDSLLNGGVETGIITEFYGSFASAKTQLCHQLCVDVQLPKESGGLGLKGVYVDADGAFRPERVKDMARALKLDEDRALKSIIVFQPKSVDEQMKAVKEVYRMGSSVGLLVVDTVTKLFRVEYSYDIAERQWRLLKHLNDLRSVASRGIAVVLANQVVSWLNEGEVVPAGGVLMDSELIRIWLSKVREGVWSARLENSPNLAEGEVYFKVSEDGVRDL